ncbi:MAG TPA: desulfoferrodoxin family protein [Bacilli bacterium]|nr:desulfoferrodoxin family protein [Bacilli bacterium]HPS18943.1 desulfoferrodoxin family protein [Bacilli bacterium]
MKQKFYRCEHCGNIIAMVHESGVKVVCCGEPMKELIPNTSEGAGEKHLPVIEVKGNKVHVKVGSVPHPMTPQHYIQWISIETKLGNQRKVLTPDSKPEACFSLCEGDEVIAAYEYCNLHGLWKTEK